MQAETKREKRRREVEFSKVGLEVPHADKVFTKKKRNNASEEVYEDKNSSPAMQLHSVTNTQSSHDEFGQYGVSVGEVPNDNVQPSMPEVVENFADSPQNEEINKSKVSITL